MKKILITLILIVATACNALTAENEKVFRLGIIEENVDETISKYEPLVGYLATKLKEFGFGAGKVVVTKNVPEMIKKIRNGDVDLLFESPFSVLEIQKKIDVKPSVCLWRKGIKEYRTLFFVRKESPVTTLAGLNGKTIVFETPKSTSAYAIPRAELKKNGLAVADAKSEQIAKGVVRYVFADAALNQAYWVVQKKADAGAFNNSDWEAVPEKIRSELRIIHETQPVLRFVGMFNPALPQKIKLAAGNILVAMNGDEEGRKALKPANDIKKIELIGEAERASLEYSKVLLRHFQ